MAADLLLLSSSRVPGSGYLEHAHSALRDFLGDARTVHFVPYALADLSGYTARVAEAFVPFGVSVVGLHAVHDPRAAVEEAEVLFVGGGNSFRLLARLQRLGLIEPIRRRVQAGALRYMGASAGSNMACPSLRTTNDMPIVQPTSFAAIGLLPFQINPHYADPDPASPQPGETREQRIREFLEENGVAVIGLRDASWLRLHDGNLRLEGRSGARLFQRNEEPHDLEPGADLRWLLSLPARFDVGTDRDA
ncbi:MAG: dipeptidase PepE [Chloroflexi bacterium]|nr:dipeptidase PepE [Chloroflexota bacterium]